MIALRILLSEILKRNPIFAYFLLCYLVVVNKAFPASLHHTNYSVLLPWSIFTIKWDRNKELDLRQQLKRLVSLMRTVAKYLQAAPENLYNISFATGLAGIL